MLARACCRALVCPLALRPAHGFTYSEVTYSIYKQRVVCSLRYLNTDANDQAILTDRLEVHGRAECDIGRLGLGSGMGGR
eukprot:3546183-Prymnesium_polylepis.1